MQLSRNGFSVGVQSCHFRTLQIGFILSSALQLKRTLMEIKRLWMYSFHIYSLKQLHATLQGQVGNVTWWKWQCSSPEEQNETSGGVNNDSCLHSTFQLQPAKAASDIQRQELFYLLAKCSHLCSAMQWVSPKKEHNRANCSSRTELEGSQPILWLRAVCWVFDSQTFLNKEKGFIVRVSWWVD